MTVTKRESKKLKVIIIIVEKINEMKTVYSKCNKTNKYFFVPQVARFATVSYRSVGKK